MECLCLIEYLMQSGKLILTSLCLILKNIVRDATFLHFQVSVG